MFLIIFKYEYPPYFQAHEAIERETLNKKEITELRNKMVHRANNIGEYSKQAYDDLS